MSKVESIISELKTLSLLEASELVIQIEDIFGVDASSNISGNVVMSNSIPTETIEEKSEFDLILEEVPADKKIAILKVVRALTGLGLKEAKLLVESAPKQIQEGLVKDVADDAKKQLETVGAIVSLK